MSWTAASALAAILPVRKVVFCAPAFRQAPTSARGKGLPEGKVAACSRPGVCDEFMRLAANGVSLRQPGRRFCRCWNHPSIQRTCELGPRLDRPHTFLQLYGFMGEVSVAGKSGSPMLKHKCAL